MAIIKHISDGTNTWDLPAGGEAFKIPLSGTLSDILNGGSFTISGIKTADLKTAIANGQPIVFIVKSTGNPQHTNEILITNLGSTGGSGLALTDGTIAVTNSGTLKIMRVVFSGGATNVTSVGIWNNTPGQGVITLDSLSDVDIYQALDGDVLTYDGNTNNWVNKPAGGGGGSQLPVIIDVGRIIHQNGQPQATIADVPQNNYAVPFDRQIIFTYRAYEMGQMYNRYWTITPCAYKINTVDQNYNVIGNADDLHWIVQDLIDNQQLPLISDIRYMLSMYTILNNATYKIDVGLWLSANTTADKIEFYLDSTQFVVSQVQYPGAD